MNEWMKKESFLILKKIREKEKSWEQVSLEMGGKKNNKKSKGEGIEKRRKLRLWAWKTDSPICFSFFPWELNGPALLVFSAGGCAPVPLKGEVCWVSAVKSTLAWLYLYCSLASCSVTFYMYRCCAEVPSAETLREAGRINLNKAGSGIHSFAASAGIWLGSTTEGIMLLKHIMLRASRITEVRQTCWEGQLGDKFY